MAFHALPKELIENWFEALRLAIPGAKRRPKKDLITNALKYDGRLLRALWESYTSERKNISRLPMSSKEILAPYLLGFHMSNLTRSWTSLQRANQRHQLIDKLKTQPLHLIDLGCGTGAMSLAWISALSESQNSLTFDLVERSKPLVDSAMASLQRLNAKAHIRALKQDIDHESFWRLTQKWKEKTDSTKILLMGYFWNELSRNARLQDKLLHLIEQLLKQDLLIMWVDPAEEISSKKSLELREKLFNLGAHFLYPCPSSHNCPMMKDQKNWCYSEIEEQTPEELIQVNRYLGIKRTNLGASAYIAASPSLMAKLNTTASQPIVVGRPQNLDKRGFRYLLCDGKSLSHMESGKSTHILRGEIWKKN